MKNYRYKLFFITSLLISTNLLASYKVERTYENGAYEDVLLKNKGINNFTKTSEERIDPLTGKRKPLLSEANFIPMAQLDEEKRLVKANKKKFYSINELEDLDSETKNTINKELRTADKRFYFGNGNRMLNLIFLDTNAFEEETKKNKGTLVDGGYIFQEKIKGTNENAYTSISKEEYEKNYKGKTNDEIVKHLKNHLKDKMKIDSVIKNGKLYDTDGNEIFWNVNIDERGEVFTEISLYEEFKNSKRYPYFLSTDGSIYVDNKKSVIEKGVLVQGKKLTDTKEWQNYNKKIEAEIKAGKSLEEAKKSYSKQAFEEDLKKLEKASSVPAEVKEKRIKEIEGKLRGIDRWFDYDIYISRHKLSLGLDYAKINGNPKYKAILAEIEELYKLKTEVDPRVAFDKKWEGLYIKEDGHGSGIYAEGKLSLIEEAKYIEFRGKGRVEGTVDLGEGYNILSIREAVTGEGTNIVFAPSAKLKNVTKLLVGTHFNDDVKTSRSGRYSVAFEVEKNDTETQKARNEKGELIHHALYNSDQKMLFNDVTKGSEKTKDRALQFMVANFNKDEIINLGRAMEYTYSTDTGMRTDIMQVVSDSIAHEITVPTRKASPEEIKAGKASFEIKEGLFNDRQEKDLITIKSDEYWKNKKATKDGSNSIAIVKIKDSIEGLDQKYEEFYKSLKNSDSLGTFARTFTTTNKKTLQGGTREEEALLEFKKMAKQYTEKNIYSRLNKFARDEMQLFSMIAFHNEANMLGQGNMHYGGSLTNRIVKKDIKGNISGMYMLVSRDLDYDLQGGIIFGGFGTKLNEGPLESTASKNDTVYLGTYLNKKFASSFNLIGGMAIQNGRYEVSRIAKNKYQTLKFTGKGRIKGLDSYLGFVYSYQLPREISLRLKSKLSYQYINQGAMKENSETGADISVNRQNFQYLTAEVGLDLTKKLYEYGMLSQMRGGISVVRGLHGYNNKDLVGKINNSTSSFKISGDKEKNNFIKISLGYDVIRDSGILYGIEGGYMKNSATDNIEIGAKVGYKW
ncbi:MAG: autotransporter outer membrane beta-barrel domain-containing protein [Fusobacterium sp.]|uniref:autotransporter outer membrane beta-barrel domain-containing protein n=1 Tax=Fusobacterium sp. TaxID=68766 RepID=UPI0026DB8EF9|nr:autotransporter outer membrane beta-barrel domain-containing protein [Fusobacterium sp.]MDO4690533.1 autotransporter outer membrane beta-barrel domain-containing protein [Fusobacterium sp.]